MAQNSNSTTSAQDKPSGASAVFNGRYMPPPDDDDGQRWVRASAIIQASHEALYARWRDVESSTQWHGQTVNVRKTGNKTSHWTMKVGEKNIEWDSEILAEKKAAQADWRP